MVDWTCFCDSLSWNIQEDDMSVCVYVVLGINRTSMLLLLFPENEISTDNPSIPTLYQ